MVWSVCSQVRWHFFQHHWRAWFRMQPTLNQRKAILALWIIRRLTTLQFVTRCLANNTDETIMTALYSTTTKHWHCSGRSVDELSVCCDGAECVPVQKQWNSHRQTCPRRRRYIGWDAASVALQATSDRPPPRILSSRCSSHRRRCSGSSLYAAACLFVIFSCTLSPLYCRHRADVAAAVDDDDDGVTCLDVVWESCSCRRSSLHCTLVGRADTVCRWALLYNAVLRTGRPMIAAAACSCPLARDRPLS